MGGTRKAIILRMVERDGEVRSVQVTDTKGKTVKEVVREKVAKGSTLMRDEHKAFTDRPWTTRTIQ
jgi:hypothetical protein